MSVAAGDVSEMCLGGNWRRAERGMGGRSKGRIKGGRYHGCVRYDAQYVNPECDTL